MRGVSYAAGVLVALSPCIAEAAPLIVRDGPAFSVDLERLQPCMHMPASLRSSEWCLGDASVAENVPPPVIPGHEVIGIGIFPIEGGRLGMVIVEKDVSEPAPGHDEEAMLRRLATAAPSGSARVSASNVRSVRIFEGRLASRASLRFHAAAGLMKAFDHASVLVSGSYAVALVGPSEASAQMDALLDAISPTVSVPGERPAPPAPEPKAPTQERNEYEESERWAPYVIAGLVSIVLARWWVHRVRARRRRYVADDG